jgi:hypothetical protein
MQAQPGSADRTYRVRGPRTCPRARLKASDGKLLTVETSEPASEDRRIAVGQRAHRAFTKIVASVRTALSVFGRLSHFFRLTKSLSIKWGWAFPFATGLGMIRLDEYGVAAGCFVLVALLLLLKAVHWQSIPIVLRLVLALAACGLGVVLIAGTITIKAQRPWSAVGSRWWPAIQPLPQQSRLPVPPPFALHPQQPPSPLKPPQSPKQEPKPEQEPAPTVETIRVVSQESVPSDNPELPYGLKVVVQTNVAIQPVSIVFEFTGAVGKGSVSFGGEEFIMFIKERSGPLIQYPNMFLASFESPSFGPEKAMVITVDSKERIQATGRFQKVPFRFP